MHAYVCVCVRVFVCDVLHVYKASCHFMFLLGVPTGQQLRPSWHQLRPCISAWWRHLSSQRWQVPVMCRTLSSLDRSENTWWFWMIAARIAGRASSLSSSTKGFPCKGSPPHHNHHHHHHSRHPLSMFQGRSLWICLWAFLKQTGVPVLEFTSMASPIRVSERLWLSAMSDQIPHGWYFPWLSWITQELCDFLTASKIVLQAW